MENKYLVHHSFKSQIFVPLVAINNNVEFLYGRGDKICRMNDGIIAKATKIEIVHIASERAEEIIKSLYGMNVLAFMRKWYNAVAFSTVEFIYVELEKWREELDEQCDTDGE